MTRTTELIELLGLAPHPERGWYKETYRAPLVFDSPSHGGPRAVSTAIYFLLGDRHRASHLHRLRSDEMFHLYEGGPLEVLLLGPVEARLARLGRRIEAGDRPQLLIPAGTWFGTELSPGVTHALFGCTVAPGFDFADFELAAGPELAERWPAHADRIARMGR